MDDPSQSITTLKSSFIRSQVRHLSTPLEASTTWREFAPEVEPKDRLSDKAIQDLVSRVNDKIKHHNRMLYSQQSQRHVAEQIETLYWNTISASASTSGDPDLQLQLPPGAVVVTKDTDLTDTNAIEDVLPEQQDELYLDPEHAHNAADADADMYTHLRGELLELAQRRDMLKERVARYRDLEKKLEPLSDAQVNVQPNLVTRDGELSRELDRMRVLIARVVGSVGEMGGKASQQTNGQTDTTTSTTSGPETGLTERQKLAFLMDMT